MVCSFSRGFWLGIYEMFRETRNFAIFRHYRQFLHAIPPFRETLNFAKYEIVESLVFVIARPILFTQGLVLPLQKICKKKEEEKREFIPSKIAAN